MYRISFDHEIGTPPPSSIDVDRVIRRRRRSRRLRTALAGTAAVALVGATIAALPEDPGKEQFAVPAPSSSGGEGTSKEARLEAALRGFLDAKIPGAEYSANRAQHGPLAFEHRHKEAKKEVPGVSGGVDAENYYYATADISTPAGTGNIAVGVGRSDPEHLGITARCHEGGLDAVTYTCTPSESPRGDRIMIAKTTGGKAVHYRIEVVRTDGMAVFVQVTNNSRKGAQSELELDRADSLEPPLTPGEASDLALLPALKV